MLTTDFHVPSFATGCTKGGRATRQRSRKEATTEAPSLEQSQRIALPPASVKPRLVASAQKPAGGVREFLATALEVSIGSKVGMTSAYLAYVSRCKARDRGFVDPEQFFETTNQICRQNGIPIEFIDSKPHIMNVQLMLPLGDRCCAKQACPITAAATRADGSKAGGSHMKKRSEASQQVLDHVERVRVALENFRRAGTCAEGVLRSPPVQVASLKVAREELNKAIAIIEQMRWRQSPQACPEALS